MRTPYTLSDLSAHAISMKGTLLSTDYKDSNTTYEWQCQHGHVWKATWGSILHRDGWCPVCRKRKLYTLAFAQNLAKSRGGSLLSTEYLGCKKRMRWMCAKQHIWETSLNHILNDDSWCPHCRTLASETLCISLAKELFSLTFKKERIYFDSTNKHRFLEFDGYNEQHKIAIEYQGIQHFMHRPKFHSGLETFEKQQERDNTKREYCKANNIYLIEISYASSIKEQLQQEYIKFLESRIPTSEFPIQEYR